MLHCAQKRREEPGGDSNIHPKRRKERRERGHADRLRLGVLGEAFLAMPAAHARVSSCRPSARARPRSPRRPRSRSPCRSGCAWRARGRGAGRASRRWRSARTPNRSPAGSRLPRRRTGRSRPPVRRSPRGRASFRALHRVRIVGSKKKGPISGRAWPPASTVAPLPTASWMCAVSLVELILRRSASRHRRSSRARGSGAAPLSGARTPSTKASKMPLCT